MFSEGTGIIFKDDQATPHYWRRTVVTTLGIPSAQWTDLGTTIPT